MADEAARNGPVAGERVQLALDEQHLQARLALVIRSDRQDHDIDRDPRLFPSLGQVFL